MILSKQQILLADDRPTEDVDVPEWGGSVRLRVLSGAQREAVEIKMHQCRSENTNTSTAAWKGLKNYILSCAMVDESGAQMFAEKEVASLGEKNGSVIERLYEFVLRQNAFTKDETDELRKN